MAVFNTNTFGTTATYEYDPVQDSWDKNKSPVPFPRTRYSVASLNNRIYALATSSQFGITAGALAEYDPALDIWVIKPPASSGRYYHGLAATGEKLYALGGADSTFSPSVVFDTVDEFDPLQNTWQPATSMPTGRYSLAAAAIGDTLYAIGGADVQNVPLAITEAASTGDLSPTLCDLALSLSGDTLTLDFELATPQSVDWSLWVSFIDQTVPLWSISIPAIATSIPYSLPIPGFPSVGRIGFLVTFATPSENIVCSDWTVIDTGPVVGSSREVLQQLLMSR